MSKAKSDRGERIDGMMEEASRALAAGDYFGAERSAVAALRKAYTVREHERMARILLPLQEARRQILDMAFEAGHVGVIDSEAPMEGEGLRKNEVKAGCYLVRPPRVGADGRNFRVWCRENGVAACVLTREPRTRAGLWPIVAVGPTTLRTQVSPPRAVGVEEDGALVPGVEWFVSASEALGDEAIEQISTDPNAHARVEKLFEALETHPDHEKLHQALGEACREAMRGTDPRVHRRRMLEELEGAEADEDGDEDDR